MIPALEKYFFYVQYRKHLILTGYFFCNNRPYTGLEFYLKDMGITTDEIQSMEVQKAASRYKIEIQTQAILN